MTPTLLKLKAHLLNCCCLCCGDYIVDVGIVKGAPAVYGFNRRDEKLIEADFQALIDTGMIVLTGRVSVGSNDYDDELSMDQPYVEYRLAKYLIPLAIPLQHSEDEIRSYAEAFE